MSKLSYRDMYKSIGLKAPLPSNKELKKLIVNGITINAYRELFGMPPLVVDGELLVRESSKSSS